MDEILAQAFSTGDLKIVIVAAILYCIIWFQRKDTKKSRDDAQESIETRITLLENELKQIKDLDLASKLAQIMTDLEWIKENMKHHK